MSTEINKKIFDKWVDTSIEIIEKNGINKKCIPALKIVAKAAKKTAKTEDDIFFHVACFSMDLMLFSFLASEPNTKGQILKLLNDNVKTIKGELC